MDSTELDVDLDIYPNTDASLKLIVEVVAYPNDGFEIGEIRVNTGSPDRPHYETITDGPLISFIEARLARSSGFQERAYDAYLTLSRNAETARWENYFDHVKEGAHG